MSTSSLSSAKPTQPQAIERTLFFALVLLNLVFFAWVQNAPPGEGHEPHRLQTQIEPEQVKVLPPPAKPNSVAATAPSLESPTPAPVAAPLETQCRSFSGITAATARGIEADLSRNAPGLKLAMPQGKTSYWVFIPPLANKAAADKKIGELRKLGVEDAFLMQDKGPQQFAISLGLFRSEALASAYLESLGKKGVRSARLETQERGTIGDQEKIEIEIRGVAEEVNHLEKRYPQLAELVAGECKAP